jgi:AraC-like DNA-binding protein
MAELLLLSGAPAAADALRRALQREAAGGVLHTVRRARDWAELAGWAAAPGGGRMAFVDPLGGGGLAADEIRRLRERCPALEVVALADFTRCPAADAFRLAVLGVREIICTAECDAAARVADALGTHLNRGALETMVEALAAALPPAVHRWMAPFLLAPRAAATVPELARAALCSPRTLRRALRVAGLPAPEELLAWRRLLHAGRLLDDGRSADGVARALDFSTGSALRKSLKRHTGLLPGELRRQGGFSALAALFLRRCSGGRDASAAPAARVPSGAGGGRFGYGTGPAAAAD